MNYLNSRIDIRSRFIGEFGTALPVDFPNFDFQKPDLVDGAAWLRFRILDGAGQQLTIGSESNACRFAGVIAIQVFTAPNVGDSQAWTLAQNAANVFIKWSSESGVVCRIPTIKEIGTDEAGWFQVNVSVPFVRDELI